MINVPLVLAQESAPPSPPGVAEGSGGADGAGGGDAGATVSPSAPIGPNPNGSGQQQGFGNILFILMIVMGVMIVFSMTSQRKEKKKRQAMLDTLKKGDKVSTVGGITGTVVEVRPTDVVVKVDENSNTRIKFLRSAIQSVVQEKD